MLKFATKEIQREFAPYVEEVSREQILNQLDDISNFMAFAADFIKNNDMASAERASMQAIMKMQSLMTSLRGGQQ
jgi:hypothetical protein